MQAMRLSQHIVQAVRFDTIASPLAQLPHFDDRIINQCAKVSLASLRNGARISFITSLVGSQPRILIAADLCPMFSFSSRLC
jgi:hypothetical protein